MRYNVNILKGLKALFLPIAKARGGYPAPILMKTDGAIAWSY